MVDRRADSADQRPPCPVRPSSEADLGFERRPMVRWLDPYQLIDTARRVIVSGVFSSYSDKRGEQAREPAEVMDRSEADELWLDYVADLGDGWNSTYTMARLLAAEELKLERDGETHLTERGQILVMGGDQVYPVPKAVEYENRMLGPYRSALPCSPGDAPELFAIPGSHDWYDGLVNFTSIFCLNHWIGGWRTSQRRSYFALKLPNDWWLWGIDVQFGAYMDEVQLRYFAEVAADQLRPGDRIILCTGKEVESGRKTNEIHSDRDVEYLEREIIEPSGAELALCIKSGKHYYARYEEEDGPRQQITSGGGGAFSHPTHNLPEREDLPGPHGDVTYRQAATYPSAAVSKGLRKRMWLLPPYNLPLATVLGTAQVLLAFVAGLHLRARYLDLDLDELIGALWENPTAFLLALLMLASLAGMVRSVHEASGLSRLLLALGHSTMQLASGSAVLIAASWVVTGREFGVSTLVVFLVLVGLLGGLAGMVTMSGYLWAANCLGLHGNEGYASLHHQDLKHFLRLHFRSDGSLRVYPIGVDRVGRKWKLVPEGPPHAPWFEPLGAEPEPHLIEGPVEI